VQAEIKERQCPPASDGATDHITARGRLSAVWKWIDRHDGLLAAVATIVLAIATVVLAGLTYRMAEDSSGQLRAMQGQIDEMEAAQRPWVDAHTTVSLPLTYSPLMQSNPAPAPHIGLTFQFKNVGHSPAFHVGVWSILYRLPNKMSELQYQAENCEPYRKSRHGSTVGFTLFPGDEVRSETMFSVNAGKEEAAFWESNRDDVALFVVGCIAYSGRHGGEIHLTPFIYRVMTLSDDGKSFIPIGKTRAPVAASHVVLNLDETNDPD
jgi:hypothetical protein